jgi:hypothetical protein
MCLILSAANHVNAEVRAQRVGHHRHTRNSPADNDLQEVSDGLPTIHTLSESSLQRVVRFSSKRIFLNAPFQKKRLVRED